MQNIKSSNPRGVIFYSCPSFAFYAPTKWEAYRVVLVRPYVRPSVHPQILWHQLLIYYQADFFQTCTDDQVGCVDDRKETIFSCDHFYQNYGPSLIFVIKSCGINSS
jgi:hypothetical protein